MCSALQFIVIFVGDRLSRLNFCKYNQKRVLTETYLAYIYLTKYVSVCTLFLLYYKNSSDCGIRDH